MPGVRGVSDSVPPSSPQATWVGGATWFCHIHTKKYNNTVIVLLKLKKKKGTLITMVIFHSLTVAVMS